jgi:hypothetical protein
MGWSKGCQPETCIASAVEAPREEGQDARVLHFSRGTGIKKVEALRYVKRCCGKKRATAPAGSEESSITIENRFAELGVDEAVESRDQEAAESIGGTEDDFTDVPPVQASRDDEEIEDEFHLNHLTKDSLGTPESTITARRSNYPFWPRENVSHDCADASVPSRTENLGRA